MKISCNMDFFGILQVAFIILKLLKVIDWSWWVVLIPLWIMLGFIVLFLIYAGVMAWVDR